MEDQQIPFQRGQQGPCCAKRSDVGDADAQVVGVVQMINKANGPFGPADEEVLDMLSGQAGIALRNADLWNTALANQAKVNSMMDLIKALYGNLGINSLIFTFQLFTGEAWWEQMYSAMELCRISTSSSSEKKTTRQSERLAKRRISCSACGESTRVSTSYDGSTAPCDVSSKSSEMR